MQINPGMEKDYEDYKAVNSQDFYSQAIVDYGEAWANLMEAEIAKGNKLEDIAQRTEREADTEGITGFMYGAAVSALRHFWIHGQELAVWHNKKYHSEDKAKQLADEGKTVNPAIISFGE